MKYITKKKMFILLGTCIFSFILFGLFNTYYNVQPKKINLKMDIKSDRVEEYQVYYDIIGDKAWKEESSIKQTYSKISKFETLLFSIPKDTKNIRIDFGNSPKEVEVKDLMLKKGGSFDFTYNKIKELEGDLNEINVREYSGSLIFKANGNNPYIEILNLHDEITSIIGKSNWLSVAMSILSIILGFITANAVSELKSSIRYVKSSFSNRKLISSLSKNDFKNKYASSYLGIVWGFIHPLVTICVYWFVFQVGFRNGDVGNTPFILWFVAGIIPWFFFSEALPSTTNVFLEYSYLVKKVVFKIEVLPMVKIISSIFVHLFFILFLYIVMAVYGYYPTLYSIQFIYYSVAMICLVFSLSIFTSAVVLFFRDLGQIINIIISVGFWATPIGWQLSMLPDWAARIFKLNPMYYIVTGYRDAFVDKIYFWQRPYETLYFWAFCFIVLIFGIKIYNKLKPHFSDVI